MHDVAIAPTPHQSAPPERVAVVIPCFNEAAAIGRVVGEFRKALPDATVYVFDNNSRDATAAEARAAGAEVIPSPRQGKGNVLQHAAACLSADVYVLVDGDDTYPAAAAPAMIEKLRREGLDMVVGTRLLDYGTDSFRKFHHLGNRMLSGLISLLFRTHLHDVLSGYRVFSRRFFDVVQLQHAGFEVETEMTLQALSKRLAVAEMPVEYRARPTGSVSKLRTWSDGFLILRCIALLFRHYKPLVFFTALSILFALAAIASGFGPIREFIQTGYVLRIPRAILAAGLGVISAVSFAIGLILDTIARFHQETIDFWKRHFEKQR